MTLIQLSFFINLDQIVFKWINGSMSNTFFDLIMPWMREGLFWLPLYTFVLAVFFIQWRKKGWLILLYLLLTASICDFTSSSIIKPGVERLRPCQEEMLDVNERVACGVGYSFPSSHASNHMGMGLFFFFLFKNVFQKGRYLFILWAIIISFAQIYVGVHYPLDILGGWILGGIVAFLMFRFLKYYFRLFYNLRLTE